MIYVLCICLLNLANTLYLAPLNRVYMLTINRRKTRAIATTAKTVSGIKSIAAKLFPEVQSNTPSSWVEEITLGDDAVKLIRVVIG